MSEIMRHPWFFIGLASIFNKNSSIFSSKNIIHPWPHHQIFHPMCQKIFCRHQHDIPWKDSLWLTCSCSCAHCSQSHAHKIGFCKVFVLFTRTLEFQLLLSLCCVCILSCSWLHCYITFAFHSFKASFFHGQFFFVLWLLLCPSCS